MKTVENGRTSRRYKAVTPHNTNVLPDGECTALYVGVSGDVTIVDVDGTETLFKSAPVGILPCQTLVVKSTGTTATDIVALY